MSWSNRAFSTGEAAEIASICRGVLDVWIHRFPHPDFSERRQGRRWLSARDITALRVAGALNSTMPLAEAIPASIQHLEHPPNPRAFLIADRGRTFVSCPTTAAQFAIERGATVVPVGRIASEVEAACALLFDQDAYPIAKDRPCQNPKARQGS